MVIWYIIFIVSILTMIVSIIAIIQDHKNTKRDKVFKEQGIIKFPDPDLDA